MIGKITRQCGLIISMYLFGACSIHTNPDISSWQENIAELGDVHLPKYRVGTKFIYSNGTWEKVIETGPGWVRWQNHRNNESIGSADFTYKRSNWESSKRTGSRVFYQTQYLLDDPTTSLWPLKAGNETKFDEYGRWSLKENGFSRSYDQFWRCKVGDNETMRVAAGTFDTIKISCQRYPDSFRYYRARTREIRTWYYAPLINHWVLEERDYNGYRPNRRKELVAVVPDIFEVGKSEQATSQIKRLFQETLELQKSGIARSVVDPKDSLKVVVTPTRTLKRPGGDVCRQFTIKTSFLDQQGNYFGIACRDDFGRWKIPRI